MLFNSVTFLIFIAVVIPVYFLLPQKMRPVFLLAASYYFYMSWNVAYIGLLLGFTLLVFFLAGGIERSNRPAARKGLLLIGLIFSFGALFLFKYFDDTALLLARGLERLGLSVTPLQLNWILPVGISFYTFQLTGYLIDVYRGSMKHEKNFIMFALYISFFPQLVAGPIERAQNLLPQFRQKHTFHLETFRVNLLRVLWGYLKKVVIADRLAVFVDAVYSSPGDFGGWVTLLATLFFAVQIYCDFSGYCDIAIGIARIMGFRLMTNFDRPYMAVSIQEFWDRWHISLSTWLRDYLYIPLGGNRVSKGRYLMNVLITFTASGIWHGAGITFLLWGLIHGVMVAGHRMLCGREKKSHSLPVRWGFRLLTFAAVCAAWVFFRAETMRDVVTVFGNLKEFSSLSGLVFNPSSQLYLCGLTGAELVISLVGIALLFGVEWRGDKLLLSSLRWIAPVRWAVLLALLFACIIFGVYGANTVTQFIYFQF